MKKKILPVFLSLALLTSTAFAADTPIQLTQSGQSAQIPLDVQAEAAVFDVTVPSTLPVLITADGAVMTSSEAAIINNGNRTVRVSDITVQANNGWEVVEWGTPLTADVKEFSANINNKGANSDGSIDTTGFYGIGPSKSQEIVYQVDMPPMSTDIREAVANVTIVISWFNAKALTASPADWFLIGPTGELCGLTEEGYEAILKGNVDLVLPSTVKSIKSYAFKPASHWHNTSATNMNNCTSDHHAPALKRINSITVNDGCTTIGTAAFGQCSGLVYAWLADSVISMGESVFSDCTNLSTVHLPEYLSEIPGTAFNACKSLLSIQLPQFVSAIRSNAFASCTSLTEVHIPASVATISGAFSGCTNITSIHVDKPAGSIPNAPWGATNATVTWKE